MSNQPRVCLVYDRVNTAYGGAEHVLQLLHELYPSAPLYTSVYDPTRTPWADDMDVRPSMLQRIPGARSHHELLAPLMPLAFESHDLSAFDIVISITSAEAKGVITLPRQLHCCYLLTPPRYLYSHRTHYEASSRLLQTPMLSAIGSAFLDYLTWWDQGAATRPDVIIPISDIVRSRAQTAYGRPTAPVLYPPAPVRDTPMDTDAALAALFSDEVPEDYLLCIGRQVSYKRYDLAIRAAAALQRHLVLVGDGAVHAQLRKLAARLNAPVTFLDHVSETEVATLLHQASMLLMPGEEDFGLIGLEALGQGTPVVTNVHSGVAECIEDTVHGIHIDIPRSGVATTARTTTTAAATQLLLEGIARAGTIDWNPSLLHDHMTKYDDTSFKARFATTIDTAWQHYTTEGAPWQISTTPTQ